MMLHKYDKLFIEIYLLTHNREYWKAVSAVCHRRRRRRRRTE